MGIFCYIFFLEEKNDLAVENEDGEGDERLDSFGVSQSDKGEGRDHAGFFQMDVQCWLQPDEGVSQIGH